MASEKQIAANKANAKRSTGPKTKIGKSRSRQNAFRHGLSVSNPQDEPTLREIDALARAFAGKMEDREGLLAATAMASAQIALLRIEEIRAGILSSIEDCMLDPVRLRRAAALDRYERYARTKLRRAVEVLDIALQRRDNNKKF